MRFAPLFQLATLTLLGVCISSALAACSLVLDYDHFDSGECPSGTKACSQACVPTDNPGTGCAQLGCAPCFVRNAVAKCDAAGKCQIAACSGPFADCNGSEADGCEQNLSNSREHCGQCNNRCDLAHATPTCASRTCVIVSCEEGYADCDGAFRNGCEVFGTCSESGD